MSTLYGHPVHCTASPAWFAWLVFVVVSFVLRHFTVFSVQSPAVDVLAVGLTDGRIMLHNFRYDETIVKFTQDWGAVISVAFRTGVRWINCVAAGASLLYDVCFVFHFIGAITLALIARGMNICFQVPVIYLSANVVYMILLVTSRVSLKKYVEVIPC